MSFGSRKKLEGLFSSVLSQFKKYHPPGNFKFHLLGISQKLKFRISMDKILQISLKLNFTPNALSWYGYLALHSPETPLGLANGGACLG